MHELVEQIKQYEDLAGTRRRNAQSPITNTRTIGPWRVLGRRPTVKHDTSLVLLTSRGELKYVPDRLPATTWAFGHIRRYFEIDMKQHRQVIPLTLPCKNDILRFRANMEVRWRVVDPKEVVRSSVSDGAAAFTASVAVSLRRISRSFDLENLGKVEDVLNEELSSQTPAVSQGIEVLGATLEMDQDNMLRAHELMKRREEQSAEIVNIRSGHVEQYVQRGTGGMLAYHLAQNPKSVLEILDYMSQQEDKNLATTISVVGELIGSGAIQDIEAEHEVKDALQNILERFRSVRPRITMEPISTEPRRREKKKSEVQEGAEVLPLANRKKSEGYDSPADAEDNPRESPSTTHNGQTKVPHTTNDI
ncbi:hypothetical protein ACWEV3_16575 [Saccharopolyspora sp. NPDC003752]